MSPSGASPVFSRALLALTLYTFAAWVLIGAALFMWAPGRSLAAGAVSNVARAMTGGSPSAAVAALAPVAPASFHMPGAVVTCSAQGWSHGFSDNGDGDFSWSVTGDDDDSDFDDRRGTSQRRGSKSDEATFRFRDRGTEYVVTDPAIVNEVRDATRPLLEIGRQMGEVGGEMGRNGARMGRIGGRLGAASARLAMIEARMARGATATRERVAVDASLQSLRAEIAELGAQMERVRVSRGDGQQDLSRRMSELSAKHQTVLKEVRQQVREIATRARREGKAGRPHANA